MTHERDSFSLRADTLITHDGPTLTDACVFVSHGTIRFIGKWDARPDDARGRKIPELTARLVTPALVAFHVAARPDPSPDAPRDAFRARCAGDVTGPGAAGAGALAITERVDSTKRRALAASIGARTYTYARQGAAALVSSTHLGSITGGALKLARAATGLDEPICDPHAVLSLTPGADHDADLESALTLLADLDSSRADLVEVACGDLGFSTEAADSILSAAASAGLPVAVRAGLGSDASASSLAARHGARYVLDLDLSPDDVDAHASALASAGVALALTPARALTLRRPVSGALTRAVLDAGGAVILSPGSDPTRAMTDDLSLVAALAASLHGMSPEEILAGLTLAPAEAIGLDLGRLREGAMANLSLFACQDLADIPFSPGASHCVGTVYDGRFVYWVDSEEVS